MQVNWEWKTDSGTSSSRLSSLTVDGYEIVGEHDADEAEVTIAYVLWRRVTAYI